MKMGISFRCFYIAHNCTEMVNVRSISRWFLNFLYFRSKWIDYLLTLYFILAFVLLVHFLVVNCGAVLVRWHIKIDFMSNMMYYSCVLFCSKAARVNKWMCDNWIIPNFGTFLHVIVHLSEKLFTIILQLRMGTPILPLSSLSLPLTKSHSLQQRHSLTHTHTCEK